MPFCPECHAEYDKGYTVCADCGCGLVDELLKTAAPPEEPPLRAMRPALLYSTDGLQSQLIANILEQAITSVFVPDIPYMAKNFMWMKRTLAGHRKFWKAF